MMVSAGDELRIGWIVVSVAILLWNVLLSSQISRARRQSPLFLAFTSICGLFVVPAALIVLAAGTTPTGRVIFLVAWIWPLVLLCYVVQSGYALFRRYVTSLLAVPIFVYNCVVFVAAVSSYASRWMDQLPAPLVGAAVAQAGALGILFGREALWSPWLVLLPFLSPAYPAVWRISRTVRALIAVTATAAVVLVVTEYPRAVYAAQSFSTFGSERLQERPRGDFAIGLRIFPSLDGAPAPLPLSRDLALADSIGVRVVSVLLLPSGAHALALDSLEASLDIIRRDSVQLLVTLGYDRDDASKYQRDPSGYLDRRVALIDRIVRRLRPDVLVPALDPMDAGRRALGNVPAAWWHAYLDSSARRAHALRPRTRVGVAVSSFTPDDSALYAWGERTRDIDLLGFSLAPSFGGGTSLADRLRLAERWMRSSRKGQWIWSARAYPRTFGEANQQRAIWGVLTWATRQAKVRGVVIEGASDYEASVGLRDPGGRLRPVVATVTRARAAIDETAEGR
ncbi:MAG: hypothetical protein IT360_04660 [Gemmatimonadaceae bacterium]|nr:hypothetical protein [Gemmatimonadaceae bacterium]